MSDNITYEIRKSYMNNMILDTIKCISDLEYQQKAWVEGSIPNNIDSWDETMCEFFNDAAIDYFLENIEPEYGLSEEQIDALWKFRTILRRYSHAIYQMNRNNDYIDDKIIQDPEWHKVVEVAKETLKAFEGYEVPPDPDSAESA